MEDYSCTVPLVSPTATKAEIKKRNYMKARQVHPDKEKKNRQAAEKFQARQVHPDKEKKNRQAAEKFQNAKFSEELTAYEKACLEDNDVGKFDYILRVRTGPVIDTLVNGVKMHHHVSLKFLNKVTTCLRDTDENLRKVIVQHEKDIWGNPDVARLVQEYFTSTEETLNFFNVLRNCLLKAKKNQHILKKALLDFPAADSGTPEKEKCRKVLKMLADYNAAESPFANEVLVCLNAIRNQHKQMLEKLEAQRSKLDKKLKHVKLWRKISSIIFVATFATVLICSAVVTATAAPPVAAALSAAAAIPIGSFGKCIKVLWRNYEDTLKAQREVISTMHDESSLVDPEFVTIRFKVNYLVSTLSYIMGSGDCCLKDPEALLISIEDIKSRWKSLDDDIEQLLQRVDQCRRDIEQSRTLVLQKKALKELKKAQQKNPFGGSGLKKIGTKGVEKGSTKKSFWWKKIGKK